MAWKSQCGHLIKLFSVQYEIYFPQLNGDEIRKIRLFRDVRINVEKFINVILSERLYSTF